MAVKSFKDLLIWQRSMDLVELKYLQKTESEKLLTEIIEISKIISSLISKLH